MKYDVFIVFHYYEMWDDCIDAHVWKDDIIDIFDSYDKAINFIREEIIEKHRMEIEIVEDHLTEHGEIQIDYLDEREWTTFYNVRKYSVK